MGAHASFYDVPADHPYLQAIDFLTRQEIVRGYEDRSFRPQNAVTRAEFSKILMQVLYPAEYIESCLSELPTMDEEVIPLMDFPDVPYDSWFAPYVCTAYTNGIVDGYPNGYFYPEEGVSFVEAAKMLSLGFGLTGVELPNLGREANAYWYQPYVEFLAQQKAIPYTIEALDKPVNRGEVAEMMYRLKDFGLKPAPTQRLSKTAEQITNAVNWAPYTSYKYSFAFEYPDIWPEPLVVPRGRFDGRSPYQTSSWTVYFGPRDNDKCIGGVDCVERDFWIDGYPLYMVETIVDSIFEDEYFIEVLDEPVINGLPGLVILEEVDGCIDKRGFVFGENWVYVLNFRCGGEEDRLFNLFDQLVRTVEEIVVPEHRR